MLAKILAFNKAIKKNIDLEKWRLDYWNEKTKKLRLACEQKSFPEKTLPIIAKLFNISPDDFVKSYDASIGAWKFMYYYGE